MNRLGKETGHSARREKKTVSRPHLFVDIFEAIG
jgi:hypothetical protein